MKKIVSFVLVLMCITFTSAVAYADTTTDDNGLSIQDNRENTDDTTMPESSESTGPDESQKPDESISSDSTTGTDDDPGEDTQPIIIENGVLIKYTGTSSIYKLPDTVREIAPFAFYNADNVELVILHEGITSIPKDAFSGAEKLRQITIDAVLCNVEDGAIPSGVTVVYSYQTTRVTITVNYIFADGSVAAEPYVGIYTCGDNYKINSPYLENCEADTKYIIGVADVTDETFTVIYTPTVDDTWKIVGNSFTYIRNGAPVCGQTITIDGVDYTFDNAGILKLASGFINYNGETYYVENSLIAKGYKIIAEYIYYFNNDGTMLKDGVRDGHSFDISGHLIGYNVIINFNGNTYYLSNNALKSGFVLYKGALKYFDTDFKMVKNTNLGNYRFDKDGNLSSGLKMSELTISKLSDVKYNGKAHTPNPTVKFGELVLSEGIHYELEYYDNTESGTAKVTVRGIGCVEGEENITFNILGEDSCTLTINYKNVLGVPVAESYVTQMTPGDYFDVVSPNVEGYRPDQVRISGTMGSHDITFTVTYTKREAEQSDDTDNDASEPEESNPVENTQGENEPTSTHIVTTQQKNTVSFNYEFLVTVIVIATIIAGGLILLIVKWDSIVKTFKKHGKNKKHR